MKTKIKKIIKRFICKINPTYRLISRVNDSNQKVMEKLDFLIDKTENNEQLFKINQLLNNIKK